MQSAKQSKPRAPRSGLTAWQKIRVPAIGSVVILCLAAIIALSLETRNRLLNLEFGHGERAYWLVMQTQTDLLTLNSAILEARLSPEPGLNDVRRRFAVLQDQLATYGADTQLAQGFSRPFYARRIAALEDFVAQVAPTFAAPDKTLAAALPSLGSAVAPMERVASELAALSRADHAKLAAVERAEVSSALLRLVSMSVFLVMLLSVLSIQLLRLYLSSRSAAEDSRRTGERLETIFATSADAILVTDVGGEVLDCNRAALTIFGHPRDVLIGADAMSLLFPVDVENSQRAQVTEALRTAPSNRTQPLRLEMQAQRADGSTFPVEISLAAARAEKGGIIVALLRDISDRRRAEQDLTEARDHALAGERAKAEFLAVMSHEMRTPLNGLVGSVELMMQTALDARQREIVDVLSVSAQILLDHINSVLDIARLEAVPLDAASVPFDIDRLLDDCVANQSGFAAASGNRIVVLRPSGLIGTMTGDPTRVRQILLNLLNNAAKFTSDGRITVEARVLQIEDRQLFEARVNDTGTGIPAADLERIFEDFVTLDAGYGRRTGGTGLGLGISRRLARAMGGDIGVESTPGRGSRFWVRLPLCRPSTTIAPPAPLAVPVILQPCSTVLLIEDNAINRFVARSFLEGAGHKVVEARDGAEGLAAAASRRFDVILTDISMPGLDGFQVARQIRSGGGLSAGSRILALTAHSLSSQQAELRQAGIDGFIQKPVGRDALLRSLNNGPAGQTDAPLDAAPLQELETQIGEAAMSDLIHQLLLDGDMIMARIAALGAAPSTQALGKLVHQFSGLVGTFGARPLHHLLARLTRSLRQGEPVEADLARLSDLWTTTREALVQRASALSLTAPE